MLHIWSHMISIVHSHLGLVFEGSVWSGLLTLMGLDWD